MLFLFLILFIQLGAVFYGFGLLSVEGTLRNPKRISDPPRFARQLAYSALGLILFGILAIVTTILGWVIALKVFTGWEELYLLTAWGVSNTVLPIAASLFLWQASRTFDAGISPESDERRERIARRLKGTGILVLIVPVLAVMSLYLFSLWFLLFLVLAGSATTLILAIRRKADQAAVLWALAISTKRQLPLPEELNAVADGLSAKQRLRTRKLAELLDDGCPLTVALEQTPGVIPRFAVLSAQLGEENGTLPEALRDAAVRHTRSAHATGSGVSSPTMVIGYLLFVPFFCLVVHSSLMYFIMPKYKKIFDGFQTELPDVTVTLINVSDFVVSQSYVLIPLLLLPTAAVFCAAAAHKRGWGEYDPPLFGRRLRRLDVPNLLRNLGLTISAGRPIQAALELMSVRHPRKALRASLAEVLRSVRSGDDCWHALKDAGLLSPHETAVLRSAQRVGNLPWALQELADGMERRFSYRWAATLEVLQPAVVIVIGLSAAAIYFAFFLPLLKLIGGLT